MKTAINIACAASLLILCLAAAQAEETVGRVRGIYYEASRGVLVDASMLRKPNATRWAQVELQEPHPEKGRHLLVQLPVELQARIGDRVAVQAGESRATRLAAELPTLAVDRVTGVLPPSQVAAPGR